MKVGLICVAVDVPCLRDTSWERGKLHSSSIPAPGNTVVASYLSGISITNRFVLIHVVRLEHLTMAGIYMVKTCGSYRVPHK